MEGITAEAEEEHDGKVSISRNIINLQFSNDIDGVAEEEQEQEALIESHNQTCIRYKMEISAEKTKLMTNSASGIQREIKVKGKKVGAITSFKYVGAVISDHGSKCEILSNLKPIWRDNNISLELKVTLMRFFLSFLSVCL